MENFKEIADGCLNGIVKGVFITRDGFKLSSDNLKLVGGKYHICGCGYLDDFGTTTNPIDCNRDIVDFKTGRIYTNPNSIYVSSATAEMLKKFGFDWECAQHYNEGVLIITSQKQNWNDSKYENCISAPTLFIAQKWLREEKKIYIDISTESVIHGEAFVYKIIDSDKYRKYGKAVFNDYECALDSAIYESVYNRLENINILKYKQQ